MNITGIPALDALIYLAGLLLTGGLTAKHPRAAAWLHGATAPKTPEPAQGLKDYDEVGDLIAQETGRVSWDLHGPQLAVDGRGYILEANDHAKQLLGTVGGDLRGRLYHTLLKESAEHMGQWLAIMTNGRSSFRADQTLLPPHDDAEPIPVVATVARVPGATHKGLRVAHVRIEDRREIKDLEQQIEALRSRVSEIDLRTSMAVTKIATDADTP